MENFDTVKEKINTLINENGFSLYSITFYNGNLDIIIDRDSFISMDEIINISQILSDFLDDNDFCNESYTLNVSTLGVEKPLDLSNLTKYIDKYVSLSLDRPVDGKNKLEGTIIDALDNYLVLMFLDKGRKIKKKIEINNILKGNIAIKF